jgi:hypothetical protein
MTYAEIRQRVLAQLSPEMDRAEIPALLYTLAYIALHRDAREAAAAMLTGSGPDRQDRADVETTLTTLEASWGRGDRRVARRDYPTARPRRPDQLRPWGRRGPPAAGVRLRADPLMTIGSAAIRAGKFAQCSWIFSLVTRPACLLR